MKRLSILIVGGLLFLCAFQPGKKNITRYGMITGLKDDKVVEYKELHAHAWPGVLKKIKECHIQNYTIFLKQIDGHYFLFSYFEYNGSDFKADMNRMAQDSITRLWWKRTDPTQIPLPDAVAQKKIWSNMDEIFHTN